MNGALGDDRYGFSSTERTVNRASASPSASDRARASSRATTVPDTSPRSLKSLPVAMRVPSTATSVASKAGWVAVREVDVPVVGGDERDAFAFALDDERTDGLWTRPADRPRFDAPPQHGRHLVAVQAVEDAAGLGGVDEAVVEVARVVHGMVDRRLGDLVEHHPLHRHLRLEVLEQVPARWPRPRGPRPSRGTAREASFSAARRSLTTVLPRSVSS